MVTAMVMAMAPWLVLLARPRFCYLRLRVFPYSATWPDGLVRVCGLPARETRWACVSRAGLTRWGRVLQELQKRQARLGQGCVARAFVRKRESDTGARGGKLGKRVLETIPCERR